MSGKTSPAQSSSPSIVSRSFYGESPPKRSRLQDSDNLRPAFRNLKDNLIKFDKKLSEPIKSLELKEQHDQREIGAEPKSLDRDSPLPLKNLGNTCYENSIIQCLFSLNMFMDNFGSSMMKMRQFVVKPEFKPKFSANCSISPSVSPEPTQQQTIETPKSTKATITENDVRYRIADAFDNLYTSYTKKRIQATIESNDQTKQAPNSTHRDDQLDSKTVVFRSESAIGQTNAAIPLCKSNHAGHPTNQENCSNGNQTKTAITSTATASLNSNFTPIALVSSTASEQSEIESRLEDLKSAVGERSSQFNSAHQQDASEFFYHVIDSIQEFYQSLDKTNDDENPVTRAFELELDYLIRCPKCHHRTMSEPEKIRTLPLALPHVNNGASTNQEEFFHETGGAPTPPSSDLGLDSPKSNSLEEQKNGSDEKENRALVDEIVPEDNSTMSIAQLDLTDKTESNNTNAIGTIHQKGFTLCDALNNYFKDDLLEYSCSQRNCDSKHRTKKCLIRKLPQVLFITLARYSYTGRKNLDEIEAPFELSVPFRENKSPNHSPSAHRDFNDDDNKYQLVAVVCHLGSSLNAGHYTSYVYNQNNYSWYSCDDDSITKVQEGDVRVDASKSGYCFFYAHKSCINQNNQSSQKQDLTQKNDSDVEQNNQLEATDAVVVTSSNNVVDSSIVLTPESSPKSSPVPSVTSQQEETMHDGHNCNGNRAEDIDDW